jgi:hypothetical protein
MARGRARVEHVLPLLEATIRPELDGYAYGRLREMTANYAGYIERMRGRLEREREIGIDLHRQFRD